MISFNSSNSRTPAEIKPRLLALQYTVLLGAFWAAFCCLIGFATVLLSAKGFPSSRIGIAVAVGNVTAVLTQSSVSSLADKGTKITLHSIIVLLCSAAVVTFGAMLFIPNVYLLVFVSFAAGAALLQIMQPLTNSVSIYYINRGVDVDFGLSRGIGSVCYAIMSSLLGLLVSIAGENAIVISGVLLFAVMGIVVWTMPLVADLTENGTAVDSVADVAAADSVAPAIPAAGNSDDSLATSSDQLPATSSSKGIFAFFLKYKSFTLVLLGVTFLFTFHNMSNTFLLYIMENCGGTSLEMGRSLSIGACCELPTMLLFSRYSKKISSARLLAISAVFFVFKAIGFLLAGNITALYLVQVLQFGAFALYIPSSVYYVNDVMEDTDKFQGQAIMVATNTLGGVLGSLIGGVLLEKYGVSAMNILDLIFAIAGAILVVVGVLWKKQK